MWLSTGTRPNAGLFFMSGSLPQSSYHAAVQMPFRDTLSSLRVALLFVLAQFTPGPKEASLSQW